MFPKDKKISALYQRVTTHFGVLPEIVVAQPSNYFGQLAESIIGQQLSNKVADVIVARVKNVVGGNLQPETILALEHAQLKSAGLSGSKAQYITNCALAWKEKKVVPEVLVQMDDETVINTLTQIKGVGRWTAEMFLMFTLGREDIFSAGDYGLRKAVAREYGIPITAKPSEFLRIAENWTPQRSTASRILWKSLELTN